MSDGEIHLRSAAAAVRLAANTAIDVDAELAALEERLAGMVESPAVPVRARRRWLGAAVAAGLVGLALAAGLAARSPNDPVVMSGDDVSTAPSAALPAPSWSAAAANDTSTTASTVATTAAPTTVDTTSTVASTVDPGVGGAGSLVLEDGRIQGIGTTSLLTDAVAVLGLQPELALNPDVDVCIDTRVDVWMLRSGTLYLFFEGESADVAVLTNWSYRGGPVLGYDELVVDPGIRIGSRRDDVLTAFRGHISGDSSGVVDVIDPLIRFQFDGDVVVEFGLVDCIFNE